MTITTKPGDLIALLPVGTRVRHRQHRELTGYVKQHEWNDPAKGLISPIPYCIGWDDSAEAHRILGWLFVYAGNESVEPIELVETETAVAA